jgi:hypothetical protein
MCLEERYASEWFKYYLIWLKRGKNLEIVTFFYEFWQNLVFFCSNIV